MKKLLFLPLSLLIACSSIGIAMGEKIDAEIAQLEKEYKAAEDNLKAADDNRIKMNAKKDAAFNKFLADIKNIDYENKFKNAENKADEADEVRETAYQVVIKINDALRELYNKQSHIDPIEDRNIKKRKLTK